MSYWNSLHSNLREAATYLSFRRKPKDEIMFFLVLERLERKLSVLHARIHNNCGDLKCDLYQIHLTDDKRCIWGNDNENALHFFFECENYSNLGVIMFCQTQKQSST